MKSERFTISQIDEMVSKILNVNFMSTCGAIKYEFLMSLSREVVSHFLTHIQSD